MRSQGGHQGEIQPDALPQPPELSDQEGPAKEHNGAKADVQCVTYGKMVGRVGDLPTAWAHLQDRLGDALSGLLETGHRAKSDADEYTNTI